MHQLTGTYLGPNKRYIEVVDYARPNELLVRRGELGRGYDAEEAVPLNDTTRLDAELAALVQQGWTRSDLTAQSLHARHAPSRPASKRPGR